MLLKLKQFTKINDTFIMTMITTLRYACKRNLDYNFMICAIDFLDLLKLFNYLFKLFIEIIEIVLLV